MITKLMSRENICPECNIDVEIKSILDIPISENTLPESDMKYQLIFLLMKLYKLK